MADFVSPNAFNAFVPSNPGGNVEGVVNTLPLAKTGISVKEIAAQVDIPLLADRPFFKELAVGAAGRISDYSVTGSVKSFEFDARWRPFETLLIRGSFQRAVRTPNIGEVFSPAQGSQLVIGTPPGALGDPCDSRSSARDRRQCGAGRRALVRRARGAGRRHRQLPVPDHRDWPN
jgi:iron complex outermembrane receptor protein